MSNVRSITQEDLDRYPSLKGKSVGDTITAEESYQLEKEYAKKNDEPVPEAVNAETGVTGTPTSIEGDDSEAGETRATRSARSSKK